MHHARPGPSGLQAFRDHVVAISTETYKGEAVGIVLLEVSTALGSRGVEGEDSLTATIHAAATATIHAATIEAIHAATPRGAAPCKSTHLK